MTIRQAYEFALIECNKLKAPSILLEDYIYLFNKAIQQYVNNIYNRCEYNQQSSDDLGFLQTTTIISARNKTPRKEFNDVVWEFILPSDYLHMLNCMAEFTSSTSSARCANEDPKVITSMCQRLTADLYPGIINNYYMKPSHKKPYYYIINRNENNNNSMLDGTNIIPTNLEMDSEIKAGSYEPGQAIDTLTYRTEVFLKDPFNRTSNQSSVNIDIHCGNSN